MWIAAGVQVIGNSVIDQPWRKVTKGCEKFEQIISQHCHKRENTELKKDLISMLSDSTRYGIARCLPELLNQLNASSVICFTTVLSHFVLLEHVF